MTTCGEMNPSHQDIGMDLIAAAVSSLMFLAAINDQTLPELCKLGISGTLAKLSRGMTFSNGGLGFDAHSRPVRQSLRNFTIGYNGPVAGVSWQEVGAFPR